VHARIEEVEASAAVSGVTITPVAITSVAIASTSMPTSTSTRAWRASRGR
jgi:hypothetical protein